MTTRITGALLALAFTALSAQPAAAAGSTPYGGYTSEQRPVTLTIAKDGRQIALARTALDINCTDGSGDFEPDAWKSVPLSRSGAFKGEFSEQRGTSFDGKPMVSGGTIAGKVNSRRRTLTGTWSIEHKITQPDGSVVTCGSGNVKFSAAAKGKGKAGFFGAFSSASYPIVVQLAKDFRSVSTARGAFELKCSKGGYRFVSDGWVRLPISKSGRFKASVTDVEEKFNDGTAYRIDSSITGAVDRAGRKLTGTWSLTWKVPEPDGSIDVCQSGKVRFSVKR
jgi:hypothetical protein